MNLVFAMDEQTVRQALLDGNIALSPIRQMGKSTILLRHILEHHRHDPIVYVLVSTYPMCDILDRMWLEMTAGIRFTPGEFACPNIITKPHAEAIERSSRGQTLAPVYVDEYMNCSEAERFHLHNMTKNHGALRFCGGVATFRG